MACPVHNPRRSGESKSIAYEYGVIAGRDDSTGWESFPSRHYMLTKFRKVYNTSGHSASGLRKAESDFVAGWKDGFKKSGSRNPLFLPKSLFDSYIVKNNSGDISIKVERIQTLAGAEKKVRELSKRYPCVGFDILSAKHGSVIKGYVPATGKAPRVETDNSRSYKQEAKQEARESVKYQLLIDGKDYATYDTRKEAEKAGKDEGGRWRVKEVRGNPATKYWVMMRSTSGGGYYQSPAKTSPESARKWAEDKERSLAASGRRGGHSGPAWEFGIRTGNYASHWGVQASENPLTGTPSHDIPELRRAGRSQWQSVAIAMREQRRLQGNPTRLWEVQAKVSGVWEDKGDVRAATRRQAMEIAQSHYGCDVRVFATDRTSNPAPKLDYVVTYWYANGTRNREYFTRKGDAERRLRLYERNHKGGHGEITTEPHLTPSQRQFGVRQNPDNSDAEALYESFHGVEPTGEIVYEERHEVPDTFTELGDLVELCVATVHGKDATIAAPDPEDGNLQTVVKLASSPDGKQLYLLGGDQSLDLDKLGFAESEERHHMLIGTIYQLTYRARKKFHKLKLTDYFHNLGEESGLQPALTYNPYIERMGITGGNYVVKSEGLVD